MNARKKMEEDNTMSCGSSMCHHFIHAQAYIGSIKLFDTRKRVDILSQYIGN